MTKPPRLAQGCSSFALKFLHPGQPPVSGKLGQLVILSRSQVFLDFSFFSSNRGERETKMVSPRGSPTLLQAALEGLS